MKRNKLLCLFLFLGIILPTAFILAGATTGTIDLTNKYAWSENGGWINFGASNGNVLITDSVLTGYAWSDNYGWINLNPTTGGVQNNGAGTLSGYAWAENAGWINFSGVVINSSGQFTGTASSDNAGTINFNCSNCLVSTDWRPQSVRASANTGGQPSYSNLPTTAEEFKIVINNGQVLANSPNVFLKLTAGGNITAMDISNFSDFKDSIRLPFISEYNWTLLHGDGVKNVYARFFDKDQQSSSAVSSSIVLETRLPDIKITEIKNNYQPAEEIILKGKTDPNSEIIFSWDDKYGLLQSDSNGDWSTNLGKMAEGEHPFSINVKNQSGNSRSISAEVTVKPLIKPEPPAEKSEGPSLLRNIKEKINSLLNIEPARAPSIIITVFKEAPNALKGKWNLVLVNAQNFK